MLRLHPTTVDYLILAIYFCVVLGIGLVARLAIKTDVDFFLSGRSLPAWITGLAFTAITFALATVLISGVNLYALALIIHLMLGWSVTTAILVAAALVLVYITLGGLTSAIYNEVLQFFVIVASLLPLTLVALHSVGGIDGPANRIRHFGKLGEGGLHAWRGPGMLVFGVLMLVWAFARPLRPDPGSQGSGRLRRAPAT